MNPTEDILFLVACAACVFCAIMAVTICYYAMRPECYHCGTPKRLKHVSTVFNKKVYECAACASQDGA